MGEEVAVPPAAGVGVEDLLGRGVLLGGEVVEVDAEHPGVGAAEDVVQAHPELDGIFGINDDSALGALAAVEKAGRLGRVVIVGFDAVPEARQAIRDGKIYGDIVQQPRTIGEETIKAVAAYMAGEAVPPTHLIPCKLFTKDDARGGR